MAQKLFELRNERGAEDSEIREVTRSESADLRKRTTARPISANAPSHPDYALLTARLAHEMERRRQAEQAVKDVEERLFEAQKMQVVGWQAAAVAHDVNNLLSVVLTTAQTLLEGGSAFEQDVRDEIEQIERAGQTAAKISHRLLAFSRRQGVALRRANLIDLNEVILGSERIIRHLLGCHVNVEISLMQGLFEVRGDPTQMEQLILNIVTNARDVMPRGGQLTIETSNVDAEEAVPSKTGEAEEWVLLTIRDTGVVIDPATAEQLFEPMFMTKGDGTGLGLFTAKAIVRQLGGFISIKSERGCGTTFEIHLPRAGSHSPESALRSTLTRAESDRAISDTWLPVAARNKTSSKPSPRT
jgi:two-component system cell cycle sensor histidine kinase/response regulator CckA